MEAERSFTDIIMKNQVWPVGIDRRADLVNDTEEIMAWRECTLEHDANERCTIM